MALLKCLYLSTKNISKKWDQAYRNWGPILSELSIMFDGNFSIYLDNLSWGGGII